MRKEIEPEYDNESASQHIPPNALFIIFSS